MMKLPRSLSLLLLLLVAFDVVKGYDVATLTAENYEELTEGKSVFIRFFAPWCGHSKKMAPDWEKLAEEWDGDNVGLIAEVDCSGVAKPLCDSKGVYKFPTVKYGDPGSLDVYDGARTYDDLLAFSKANLTPLCTPFNLEACDDEKKKLIEEYQNLGKDDIQKRIKEEQTKLQKHTKEFDAAVEKLQQDYQALTNAKDKKIAEIRSSDLRLLQTIHKAKAKGASPDGGSDEL